MVFREIGKGEGKWDPILGVNIWESKYGEGGREIGHENTPFSHSYNVLTSPPRRHLSPSYHRQWILDRGYNLTEKPSSLTMTCCVLAAFARHF